MTNDERLILRRYHEALARCRYASDCVIAGRAFRAEQGIGKAHPLIKSMAPIAAAHEARCKGEGSPDECDRAMQKEIA